MPRSAASPFPSPPLLFFSCLLPFSLISQHLASLSLLLGKWGAADLQKAWKLKLRDTHRFLVASEARALAHGVDEGVGMVDLALQSLPVWVDLRIEL